MSVKPCRWEEVCKPKDDDVAGVRGIEVYAEMRTALTPRGPTEYSPGEPGPFTGSVVSDMSLSPFEKHLSSLQNRDDDILLHKVARIKRNVSGSACKRLFTVLLQIIQIMHRIITNTTMGERLAAPSREQGTQAQ